ncbi:unnamed protein product [Prorocentrum cordatum]|uniref:DNA (cytosine-5-)-methyltransferase n=1 Tax=Prorocentrum cordatum TaxID=2364126 RepID=A0ABN9SMC1_9DINO|nr:unnamed protein product [Polarella glacialis]
MTVTMTAAVIRYMLARDRGCEGSSRPRLRSLGITPGAAGAATAADTPVNPTRSLNSKKDNDPDGGSGQQKVGGDQRRRQTDPERWARRTIGEWMNLDRCDLRLDWNRAESANARDARYLGKPFYGEHDTTHPLSRHANQYKVNDKRIECELVMLYVPKHGATGKRRQTGPLGPTVGKLKTEEITKERITKEKATSEKESRVKVEEVSSEDSFVKAGQSDEEETPCPDADPRARADALGQQITKHDADVPNGGNDVTAFGADVECHKEEINMKYYRWLLEQVTEAGLARDLRAKKLMEFCAEEDSQLGKIAEERKDAKIIRITRKDADLSTKDGLELAKNIATQNPGADILGSLPCTAVSALRNGHIGRQDSQCWRKLEARKRNLKNIVNHFMQVSRIVKINGGDVHFEMPRNCHGWRYFPERTEFSEEMGMEKVNFDACKVGVVNAKGEPIHKPWALWTSRKKLATVLSGKRRPDPGGHGHADRCGKDAFLSGRYSARMARTIWRNIGGPPEMLGMIEELKQGEVWTSEKKDMFENEKEMELTSDEQQQWDGLPTLKQNELMKAAMRLHRNTGHRPPRVLIRMLRRRGASATTIAAVKKIKCSSCIQNQVQRPRPAAVLEPARDPWQAAGIDVKEASKLTLAIKISSVPAQESYWRHSADIGQDRCGMPSVLRIDPEGAFVPRELFDNIAGEGVQAHWQNGIRTVFECAKAMHRDHETDLEAAVHAAVEAHNAVERVDGYSPSQWAFGRDKNWSGTLRKEDHLDIVKCTNKSYMENLSERALPSKIIGERILK